MDKERNITTKYNLDISNFKKGISEANQQIKLANAQFRVSSSSMDDWSKSTEGVESKLTQLNTIIKSQEKILDNYNGQQKEIQNAYKENGKRADELRSKLQELANNGISKTSDEYKAYKKALLEVEKEQTANQKASEKMAITILNTEANIEKTRKEIKNYESSLNDLKKAEEIASKSGKTLEQVLDEMGNEAKNVEKQTDSLSSKLSSGLKSGIKTAAVAVTGFIAGLVASSEASQDFVEDMGKLETAYTNAGHSAETAKETYRDFVGILGETDQSVEAVNHLAQLTDNTEELSQWTDIAAGVYATFGDSLPLEGLTEAANETAKVAKVTGPFADTLNWVTMSMEDWNNVLSSNPDAQKAFNEAMEDGLPVEDAFNSALLEMNTEQERATTITKTLTALYGEAGKTYQDVNKDLIEARQAQSDLNEANAEMGAIVTPVVNKVKQAFANFLTKITPQLKEFVDSVDWDLFAKKVENALNAISNGFGWLIQNKSAIVGAITAIISGFAVAKVGNFAVVIKGVFDKLKTGTTTIKETSSAMKKLNAILSINPYVALATAIAGVVTGLTAWDLASDETYQKIKTEKEYAEAETQAVNQNKEAWDDLNETKQNMINTGVTELEHYRSLYDELTGLVDANGKVEEKYEGRASFIVSTLKDALGLEIDLVDGVVKGYDDLTKSFDEVMEKKKAMIILEAQESTYKEAITEKANLLKAQNDLEAEMLNLEEQRTQKQLEILSAKGSFTKLKLKEELKNIDDTIEQKKQQYDTQEQMLQEYNTTIGIYETNAALAHEGRYDEMMQVDAEYVQNLQTTGDMKEALLKQQIEDEKLNLATLLEQKRQSNSDIYDEQIEASKKQITKLQEDLKTYTSTIETGNNEATMRWTEGITNQLAAATGRNIEFKDLGNGQVQMYIDGIKEGEPKTALEMQTLARNSIQKIKDEKSNAKQAGEYLLDGINQGISNPAKRSRVLTSMADFGSSIIKSLKNATQEKSPSKATKEIGEYLIEGLDIGVRNKIKGSLKQISSYGKNLVGNLNKSLSGKVEIGSLKNGLLSNISDIKGSRISENNNTNNMINNSKTNNFTQIINAPKQPSRIELYRQTRNLLDLKT